MWFLLSDKFNGSKFFDIIGQLEVLKVTFKVIRVSKTTLGAERSTFMTQRAYINNFWITLHLVYRVMPLSSTTTSRLLCFNDHYNYARWLPVHVRDMMNVRVKHPALYTQFADGFGTIAKTQNPFSMIGFDQKPKQQNKELKMCGATLNLSDVCLHRVGCGGTWNCPGYHGVWGRHAYAEECRSQASWPDSKRRSTRGFSHTPRHWS